MYEKVRDGEYVVIRMYLKSIDNLSVNMILYILNIATPNITSNHMNPIHYISLSCLRFT